MFPRYFFHTSTYFFLPWGCYSTPYVLGEGPILTTDCQVGFWRLGGPPSHLGDRILRILVVLSAKTGLQRYRIVEECDNNNAKQ